MSAAEMGIADDPLPIHIIGVLNRDGVGRFWFRAVNGTAVALDFDQLATRHALIGLFGGETWLRRHFPGAFEVVANRAGGGRRVPTGIDVVAAAGYLAQLCIDAEEAAQVAAALATRPSSWWGRLTDLFTGSGCFHV